MCRSCAARLHTGSSPCRDHLILGQQFSEGMPDALTQVCFTEKLLPRSSGRQAAQRDLREYTVEGRLNVCEL